MTSPAFTLTFPEDHVFGIPSRVAIAVADDSSVIIAPPEPGTYEIVFTNMFEGEEPFTSTYRVIVKAPQIFEPEELPDATPTDATPGT